MKDNTPQVNILQSKPSKIILIDNNKIKNLENRFLGPNNEGRAPSEWQPLEESDFENLKSQFPLPNILPPSNISQNSLNIKENDNNKNNTNTDKKNNEISDKKIDTFLQKKRNSENNFILNEENDENFSEKNNSSHNNSEFYNSKHISSQNNILNKSIKDYYHTTQIVRSHQNSNLLEKEKNSSEKRTTSKTNHESPEKCNETNNNLNTDNNISVEQLLKKINEQNIIIENKEKEILHLLRNKKENEEIISNLNLYKSSSENEIKQCRLDISNMVKEIGELKRQKKKKWIHEQQYNLGKFSVQRFSNGNIIDYWEDGAGIIEIKSKLEKIKNQKEEIEKQKRKFSSTKTKNKEADFDTKDLLNFKFSAIQKEEQELKDQKSKLEIQKAILIQEINLNNQEMNCRFSQKKEGWPLLGGRYQIVGLLGKGGYSEVYKAYDLETHMYVACKLHQLNQNWNENIKDNYIKHTIRENQIHKEINHSKIVKHFDTIEIDNNSFCTILEYCSGPDLAAYMKRNKNISEKEARIIITQILEGLEYLNKLPKKIIHYDIKPENIIFNDMEVKISDFGLAKIIESNSDRVQLTSQGVGTYWYLPPECFEENSKIDISSKVDIWSCGVILYEMFFREKPFGQNYTQENLLKDRIMQNAKILEIPNKPSISEDCKDFLRHCLAYRQSDRYDVFQALDSNFIRQDKNKDSYKKCKGGNNHSTHSPGYIYN